MKYLHCASPALVISLLTSSSVVTAFLSPSPHHAFSQQKRILKTSISATAADAIETLASAQTETFKTIITGGIPDLTSKPDLSWMDADGVTVGGSKATLDAYDAPGPDNIAWLSNLCISGKCSSLTIFNGPLTDVPHLLSRCVITNDNEMVFSLDFRPRAYGAYEMKDANGEYPGPDVLGRDSFTYKANRNEYDTKFGTEEVVAYMQATIASFADAKVSYGISNDSMSEYEVLTNGPIALSATMPLTDSNVAAVVTARQKAVEYWLSWAQDKEAHAHKPGAPINSQYVYDSKYRQNAYLALLPVYSGLFGDADGQKLAAAESGPLDEGYVGGGS